MARVFSMAKAGEPDDNTETVMTLGFRGPFLGPSDRGLGHDMGIALGGGKLGNRLDQHDATSGHGLATCCRRAVSTLA